MSLQDIEDYFAYYLGIENFIWLEGVIGNDITDDHIDGTARFADDKTIVTMHWEDMEDPSLPLALSTKTNVVFSKK